MFESMPQANWKDIDKDAETPTLEGKETTTTLEDVPGKLVAATTMPLTEKAKNITLSKQPTPGSVQVTASGRPVYLIFEKAS
jgi:hypothetical protein